MAHSMGNVVAGEALRKAGPNPVVNAYVAMQGAVPAHCYDPTTATRNYGFRTPNRYAHYWTDAMPCYFAATAGAGAYVNFFNTNDYALAMWQYDQNWKPDLGANYGYDGTNFFQGITIPNMERLLLLPADTYEIFSYCDQAQSFALGAQAGIGGVFNGAQQSLIDLWPADTHPGGAYGAHVWHSAQFRSDYMHQNAFWQQVMQSFQLITPK